MCCSCGGGLIAAGCSDGVVRLWSTISSRSRRLFSRHGTAANAVSGPADTAAGGAEAHRSALITRRSVGLVGSLVDVEASLVANLKGHTSEVSVTAFSNLGDALLTQNTNGLTVRVWRWKAGYTGISHIVLRPSTGESPRLTPTEPARRANARRGPGQQQAPGGSTVQPAEFCLATWTRDDRYVVTSQTNPVRPTHAGEHAAPVNSRIKIWDPLSGELCRVLLGHTNSVRTMLCYSSSQPLCASAWLLTRWLMYVCVCVYEPGVCHRQQPIRSTGCADGRVRWLGVPVGRGHWRTHVRA